MRKTMISLFSILFFTIIFAGCTIDDAKPKLPSKEQVIQKLIQKLIQQIQTRQNYALTYEQIMQSNMANQKKVTNRDHYQLNYTDPTSFTLMIKKQLQSPIYKKDMFFHKRYQVKGDQVFENNKPKHTQNFTAFITKNYLEQYPLSFPTHQLPQHLRQSKAQFKMTLTEKGYKLAYHTNQPETIQQLLGLAAEHTVGRELHLIIMVSPTFQLTSIKGESSYLSIEATQKRVVKRSDLWILK